MRPLTSEANYVQATGSTRRRLIETGQGYAASCVFHAKYSPQSDISPGEKIPAGDNIEVSRVLNDVGDYGVMAD